jgi:hypothetical protein
MDNLGRWWDAFEQSFSESLLRIAEYVPVLAAAVGVMLVGWVVARIAQTVFVRSGGAIGRVIGRLGQPVNSRRVRLSRHLVALISNFIFWAVILLFATAAASVAGLEAFSIWLSALINYLPTLVAGILIALAGYLVSALVRDLVSTALDSVGQRENELAGLAAQVAVLVTAAVIGLDQIGVDVTLLIILVAILLGGALLSMALAFGFGARDFVGNLIAAQQIRGVFEPGDRAKFGELEGRVVEIGVTTVVLINEQGRFFVPASLYQQQTSAIIADDADE